MMEEFTSKPGKKSKTNYDELKKINQDYDSDAAKLEEEAYNLDMYGEFIPTFYNWVSTEDEEKRLENLIENDERIWRD